VNANSARRSWLAACGLLLAAPARAVLGEDLASVHADALRLKARRQVQGALGVQVHVLVPPLGGTIRQFATAQGRVFAVAWNTPYKPRLDQLLGTHFAAYAEGGARLQAERAGIQRAARVQQGDLVVEATAHLQAHRGLAYLKSQLPAGLTADALR